VAVVLPTGPAFFDLFFGLMLLGAVPVPLYPPVRLGRLDEYFARTAAMVQAVDAAAVVTDRGVRRVLGRLMDPAVLPQGPRLGLLVAEELNGPLIAEAAEHRGRAPTDLCMVQFSSGTTVDPKPVALSHAAVLANARAVMGELFTRRPAAAFGPHAGVSWLPLYHDMGLIGCVIPALDRAATLTLLPPEAFLAKPALWLRALSRYGGTISPAPDFAYALCVDRIRDEELDGVDLSRWVAALNGAEPIRPDTLRRFTARFAPHGLRPEALTPVYGLSEAALAVTFAPIEAPWTAARVCAAALAEGRAADPAPGAPAAELVHLGPALPGFGVEVRGPDGPLPEDTVGRVFVRGPSLMSGYLGRAAQPFDPDGWLDTGDLGFLRGGGLHLCGRAKDLIVLRGQNHHPHELERAVDAVAGVRTGCAVAVGEVGEHGERVLVFVEVRERHEGQAEACRAAVCAATGVDPDLVVLLEPGTIPRTSSGKLRRGETLRQHQRGALVPPAQVGPWMLAGAMARSALGLLLGRRG
jgi:acyl-CoA synthetase (AMP-forming)/AMP-acid ligase II